MILAERIVLRKHEMSLAPKMFHLIDTNRDHLSVFLPWESGTKKVEDSKAYIENCLERWKTWSLFDYGLFSAKKNELMGNVGLHSLDWDAQRAEIGFWIGSKFEGKGYVTEAVEALEKACLGKFFHRLEIRCDEENIRSAAIAKRLGYKQEGLLRENSRNNAGGFRNTLIFGKLASDAE